MPAVHHALLEKPADPLNACIHANVAFEVRDIAKAQPVIAPMAAAGRVLVVGGIASVETGRVELVEAAS
jgi:carbonic anhydrase